MYICDFSRSVGAASATTRKTRGLTRSVIRLIVPPLPAVSRPSKTTQILAPVALTHSWSATSSPWSFAISRSYSRRFIFAGLAGSVASPACFLFFAIGVHPFLHQDAWTRARAGFTARDGSSAASAGARRRRIHFHPSTTIGNNKASPITSSHCGPVSDVVIREACRCGSSVPRYTSATVIAPNPIARRIGAVSPEVGSRRLVSALSTVASPITAKVIVIEALA